MPLTRDQAISLINSEIDFAYAKHGDDQHTTIEWLSFIRSYADRALDGETFQTNGDARDVLRIIGALAVVAIQQCGADPRSLK